ncbi:hypothetical protein HYDPIDRAFT_84925, partial [Hydnomerulius pinastri MD-312]
YEWHSSKVVFFKDSWCVNIEDILSEGVTYGKLNRAGVCNIPTCIASGDVECLPQQKMQAKRLSKKHWVCPVSATLVAHVHYRLVLDIVGSKLTTFSCPHELVKAIHDALIGEFRFCKDDVISNCHSHRSR